MATPVPVAGGFAAALETFLSQGGGRQSNSNSRRGGMRYTQGKIKGLTVEQATQKARDMWRGAPDGVKEKYANQERDMMTRSELDAHRARLVEPSFQGQSDFAAGSRRARPGDLDGDGVLDAVPGAATPEENQRAQGIAREAAGQYGESAAVNRPAGAVSTDKAPNPGLMAPSRSTVVGGSPRATQIHPTGDPGPWKTPTKRPAAPLGGVQVGMGANAGRMNPLTGRPIGYVPPAAPQMAGVERPARGFSYDADLGAVPRASVVPEAPMSMEEYQRVKGTVDPNDVNALDPRTPEASAARGRMSAFESEQNARAAAIARRERVGPSASERHAQHRQSMRKVESKIASSYGDTHRF